MKIPYFNYATIMLLVLILASAFFRKAWKGRGVKAFMVEVCVVLITTMFDIGAVHFDNLGAGNVTLKYIFHSGYLIGHTFTPLFYYFYLVSLTDTWHKLKKNFVIQFIIIASCVANIAMYFVGLFGGPTVFYINELDVYTRGPLLVSNYIAGGIFLALGIVLIFIYRKLFTTKWLITILSPYPFILVAMIIEYFEPYTIIELFFNALSLVFVYTNIQKPEEFIDASTGLGNSTAFESHAMLAYENKKDCFVIMVDIKNYQSIRQALDYDGEIEYRKLLASEIIDANKVTKVASEIFYGHQGRFFLFISKRKCDKISLITHAISTRLSRSHIINHIEVYPRIAICIVSIPHDIPDFPNFTHFAKSSFERFQDGSIVYAKELFKEKVYQLFFNINKIVTRAIDNGYLEVYYQPIYSFEEQKFNSAEALLRLNDPEYGFVPPDVFIPAAEQNGEINRIWDFVLENVCTFVKSQDFSKLGVDYIEVNLSAVQCMNEHLADETLNYLRSHNVPTNRISIEITETALTYNPELLKFNLKKLSEAGVSICLDDYGTGYSNTKRVMELPLHIVKLDKSYIQSINEDKSSLVIVKHTMKMLKDIGVKTVAEGVEDEETLERLNKMGCEYIQGYFFSKPIPKAKFVEFIEGYVGPKY